MGVPKHVKILTNTFLYNSLNKNIVVYRVKKNGIQGSVLLGIYTKYECYDYAAYRYKGLILNHYI